MNVYKAFNGRLLSNIRLKTNLTAFHCLTEKRYKHDSGYSFMAPDLPSDTAENNHVLYLPKGEETTKYSQISPMKCLRGFIKNVILFDGVIDEIEHLIEEDTAMHKTFDEIYSKVEERLVCLDYSLALVKSLQQNNSTKYKFKDKDIANMIRNLLLSENKRFTSKALYKYMREFNADKINLNKYQQRITEKYILEGMLNGCLLSDDSQIEEFQLLCSKLDKLSKTFGTNVATAVSRFKSVIDDKGLLKYFPEEFLLLNGSVEKLTIKLESNIYEPFMEYCPDPMQRWNVWRAYNARAAHFIDTKISNSIVIEDIRQSRKNLAQLLGFENYVDLTMTAKMAQSSDTVFSMINSLTEKTENKVNEEIEELTEFMAKNEIAKTETLEPWNIPYLKRQYLNEHYSLDENIVKQYFPLPVVLRGLFSFVSRMFHIDVEEVQRKDFDAWHPDVRLFRLISSQGFLGSFFFDAFVRPVDKKVTKPRVEFVLSRCDALKIKPVCHLITNLQKPISGKYSSLLSFDDVLLLFKSFGHILQHISNEMPFYEIAGLNNLEWDRVHLCSEFMALWFLHDYEVVESCSANISDGSPLPKQLFQTIKNRKLKFYSCELREELYKAALDLTLHSNDSFWKDVMQETWKRYMAPFKLDRDNHHVCSFTDIFCGNSAGSYYSRKWAEMLAADAFLSFKEVDDSDGEVSKVAKRFQQTVLSLGGGCNGKEVFRLFRGRDPSSDALLFVNNILGEKAMKKERDTEYRQKRKTVDS